MVVRLAEDRQDRERIVTSANGVMQHRLLPGAAATVCGRLGPFHEYTELSRLLACSVCWPRGTR